MLILLGMIVNNVTKKGNSFKLLKKNNDFLCAIKNHLTTFMMVVWKIRPVIICNGFLKINLLLIYSHKRVWKSLNFG
jgi:hypothetical protein